jgi:hypothetical protein
MVVGKHGKRPLRLKDWIASYTLDNKVSVAILLALAEYLKESGVNVYLVACWSLGDRSFVFHAAPVVGRTDCFENLQAGRLHTGFLTAKTRFCWFRRATECTIED